MNRADGMNYAPTGKPKPVVGHREFVFSAVRLDHGHIYGMTNGLLEAGATLKYVYDPDPKKVEAFMKTYPGAIPARSEPSSNRGQIITGPPSRGSTMATSRSVAPHETPVK